MNFKSARVNDAWQASRLAKPVNDLIRRRLDGTGRRPAPNGPAGAAAPTPTWRSAAAAVL